MLTNILFDSLKEVGFGWKWTTGGMFLILLLNFQKLNLTCKSLCLGCVFCIFLTTSTLLLSGRLGLIEYPLIFHGCWGLQKNKFSFHPKYLCYLEYFQEGNGLLGCHLVFSDQNIGLLKLCLKKCFLVTETYKYCD